MTHIFSSLNKMSKRPSVMRQRCNSLTQKSKKTFKTMENVFEEKQVPMETVNNSNASCDCMICFTNKADTVI